MTNEWHQVGFFAAGLAIGAVATAMIVLGPLSAVRDRPQARPGAPQAAAVALRGTECPLEPAAAIAGARDGRYRMPADLSGYAATDSKAFIVMGSEAATAARPHDAEIAYLMACRVADRFKGAGSLAAADARHELARHYVNLAQAAGPAAPSCGELLRRAETLYSDSLQLYRASYGPQHEKSRGAEQGLAGVRQTLMVRASIAPAVTAGAQAAAAPALVDALAQDAPVARRASIEPPTAVAIARPRARAENEAPAARARDRSSQKKVAADPARTSPACAAARTTAEKLICSDEELARLDREVAHLQARARNASKYEHEWRRREALCRDRACLLQLIANKRNQLLADINSA